MRADEPGTVPLVSITRLRLRTWWVVPRFVVSAIRTNAQARRATGNLALSVLPDAHRTFWTRSVWVDEQAMRSYILAGPHRGAMRRLAGWCDEASVVHWQQASAEPPSWSEAHARMQHDGRPSRVDRPTAAHLAHEIAPIRDRRPNTA